MVLATLMKIYTSFIGHHIVASHTWISPNVRGDGPDAREGHSAALVGKRLFIFGGCGKSSDNSHEIYYNDLYILNTGNFLHIWLVSKYLFWSCFSLAYNLCIHQVPMLYRTTKDYFLFFCVHVVGVLGVGLWGTELIILKLIDFSDSFDGLWK